MHLKFLLDKIKKNGTFIQIGSNDGVSNDEYGFKEKILFEEHKVILIEPIEEYFLALKKNFKNSISDVYFENIAITEKSEERIILKQGMDSSFVRSALKDVESSEVLVKCNTIHSIFSKYNISKVDGLFMDTEGYEYNILNSLFSEEYPTIDFIRYEFWWNEKKEELDTLLLDNNFMVFQDPESYADKIAVNKSYLETL